MRLWRFQQFRSPSGRDAITDWRRGLSPKRRASFDIFFDRISKMRTWPNGICDPIKGYSGYWELRWTSEKVEHRVFGYFAGELLFVMLIGCTHKGKRYDPASAFQTMEDRKSKLNRKEGTISSYELVNVGGIEE